MLSVEDDKTNTKADKVIAALFRPELFDHVYSASFAAKCKRV